MSVSLTLASSVATFLDSIWLCVVSLTSVSIRLLVWVKSVSLWIFVPWFSLDASYHHAQATNRVFASLIVNASVLQVHSQFFSQPSQIHS